MKPSVLVLALAGLLLLPMTVQAAVLVDNVTSVTAASVSSKTFAHTVSGSTVNRLLIVGVSWSDANSRQISSVTYGGVAMTAIAVSVTNGSSAKVQMYRLYGGTLPTGTNNVVVTWSGTVTGVIGATTFYGVDQTTPLGALVGTTGNTATPTHTVTSATGDLVVDTMAAGGGTPVVDPSQTQWWNLTQTVRGAGSTKPGAASVTMSWTLGSTQSWAIQAVPVKAAAAGAFTKLQLLVPGETAAPWTTSGVTGWPSPTRMNWAGT